MYLILTILWFVGGLVLLIYQALSGDHRLSFHLGDVPISAGWVMVLLSIYNGARWWSRRSVRPAATPPQLDARRQRVRRLDETREPDPNFNFTEEPPQSPSKPPL